MWAIVVAVSAETGLSSRRVAGRPGQVPDERRGPLGAAVHRGPYPTTTVSLATLMGPGCCHDLGTTWLRGEHGRGWVGVSMSGRAGLTCGRAWSGRLDCPGLSGDGGALSASV